MARSTQRKKEAKAAPPSDKELLKPRYHTPVYLLLIFAALLIFFADPIFQEKTFQGPDNIASLSLHPYLDEAKKEGIFPLWIPYVFSGMPVYASLMAGGERWWDLTAELWWTAQKVVEFFFPNREVFWVVLNYFVFGVALYLLVLRKTSNKFAAFFSALAGVFSTFIIIWIMVGHNTKVVSVAFWPLLFLLVDELTEKMRWLVALLLVVFVHLEVESTHVQMNFYIFFALGLYLFYLFIVRAFKRENVLGVVRSAVLLAAAGIVALVMSADRYFSTYQYNKYSIRGSPPILTDVASPQSKTQAGGLDYEYATNWSFSPAEVITFFIPSYFGFGWHEYVGPLSNNEPVRVNTYFGQMPFTDAPEYMGVITLVLAILGIIAFRREKFVQFLVVLGFVALLISFGRNFPVLFDLMFKYFPFFNKFRVPSLILSLLQFSVAVLAGYGIAAVDKWRKDGLSTDGKERLSYALYGVGALFVLSFLLKGAFESSYTSMIAESGKQIPQQLYGWMFDQMWNDVEISLGIALITLALVHLYVLNKLPGIAVKGGLAVVLLFDLWRVDYKPMEARPKSEEAQFFARPEYVSFIKQDSSLYRVLLLQNNQPPTDNTLAYYLLQNIYGYSAAKLRVYQDMMDVSGIGNPFMWNLLNMKYLISDRVYSDPQLRLVYGNPQDKNPKVMENLSVLPRVFFVKRYEVAKPLEILENMKRGGFDPKEVVYLEEPLKDSVDPPDTTARAEVVQYGIQDFTINAHASGKNILFLSEVYYPAGWKATIDNTEVPILKANYLFRAVVVPPGVHKIRFEFAPQSFYLGKNLSLWVNIGVLVLLAGVIVIEVGRRNIRKAHSRQ